MTKKWMGMIAGLALASSGAVLAQDTTSTTTPETQSQPANAPDSMGSQPSDQLGNDSAAAAGAEQQQGVGGSGSEGTSSDTAAQTGTGGAGQSSTQPATPATPASPSSKSHKDDPAAASAGAQAEQQLTATVEKVQGKTVFVDHMGAVVALTTNKSTQFEGVKRAKELQEGQQIRASFTVKNGTQNLAKSISVEGSGTGGAGLETQGGLETGTPPADTGTPPPADTGSTPPADTGSGTGGSGLEGSSGSTSGSEAGTGGSGLEDPSSTSTQPESEMDHRGLETEGQGGAGEAGGESGSTTDTSTSGDKY